MHYIWCLQCGLFYIGKNKCILGGCFTETLCAVMRVSFQLPMLEFSKTATLTYLAVASFTVLAMGTMPQSSVLNSKLMKFW